MATSESQLELFHCLPIPTGDLNDLYDFQAIRMVVVHNIMLRGFNSMAYYCSEVEPNATKFDAFLDYSSQIIELLHDHHSMEEEMYFPFLERNLGAGAMSENVSGHDTFKPQLEHLDDLVKQLRAHQTAWNVVEFRKATLDLLSPLRKHLGEEIDTLRAWKLKDHFTIAELQGFESALEERIKSNSSLTKSLQLLYVNGDAVHAAWFPKVPLPIVLLAKYALWSIHSDSWAFGSCDRNMVVKPQFAAYEPKREDETTVNAA